MKSAGSGSLAALLVVLAGGAARAQDVHPGHVTAVKPVSCRAIEDARGKTGQALAQAVERDALELATQAYELTALLPGDPPVACYRHVSPPPAKKAPHGSAP